jgi:hypothetical protein
VWFRRLRYSFQLSCLDQLGLFMRWQVSLSSF